MRSWGLKRLVAHHSCIIGQEPRCSVSQASGVYAVVCRMNDAFLEHFLVECRPTGHLKVSRRKG